MYRNYASNRLCQVDIAAAPHHKHQDLSLTKDDQGLSKMSIDIAKGNVSKTGYSRRDLKQEHFRSLKATYYRMALDTIEARHNDAMINGLSLDIHQEELAVEMFAENIIKAGDIFFNNPMERPFIPSWNRVVSAIPDIFDQLLSAVENDRKEFSPHNI